MTIEDQLCHLSMNVPKKKMTRNVVLLESYLIELFESVTVNNE